MATDKKLADLVAKTMEKGQKIWDGTSVAVGVIKDGQVTLLDGYGYRNVEEKLPADGQTLYQIGSCSKAFTAALCAIFVDKGLIDWDTPIREYDPDIRFYDDYVSDHVTLRDVLSHRTGVPRHEYSWYGTDFDRQQLVHNIRFLEPNKPFRTDFQYNNYGYLVAGAVLEKVSGKTYEELLQEYIFNPLGMKRTNAYLDLLEGDPDHGQAYDRPGGTALQGIVKGKPYRTPVEDYPKKIGSPFAPAGAINSCPEDMLKWVQLHLNEGEWEGKQLISKKNMQELHKPNIPCGALDIPMPEVDKAFDSYAMGWKVECYRGVKVLQHGGNINGYSGFTSFIPSLNLGIVAYANLTMTMEHYAIGRVIMDYYLGAQEEDWMQRYFDTMAEMASSRKDFYADLRGPKVEGTHPTFDLSAYTGTFTRPGYGPVKFWLKDGKLIMTFIGSDVPLSHYHYDTFINDVSYGGDEIKPGLPVKFYTGDNTSTIDVVKIPLVMEEGKFIRFDRVKDRRPK